MLDTIDDIREKLRGISSKCHKNLKLHGNMVEALRNRYFETDYKITLEEEEEEENRVDEYGNLVDRNDNEGEREEKENENLENKDFTILKGDIVMCTGGKEREENKYCPVLKVSESRKTYILRDSEGKTFRKFAHCVQKFPTI